MAVVILAAPASAATKCNTAPPAWWNAPRVTNTVSHVYGAGYSRSASHSYSARRNPTPRSGYRPSSNRW